jgi:hypothetical protein
MEPGARPGQRKLAIRLKLLVVIERLPKRQLGRRRY